MKEITLYTDGACSGNPGKGGWAAILIYGSNRKEISGGETLTTNNRMELCGAIFGLKALKEPCKINLFSDSAYVVNAFLKNWIVTWQTNGWKTSTNKVVQNLDLWKDLVALANYHKIVWHKVKGHADNELNNRCDFLAKKEIEKMN
ncbi:MAG: ribonuclease HI [Clostridia bacterium]